MLERVGDHVRWLWEVFAGDEHLAPCDRGNRGGCGGDEQPAALHRKSEARLGIDSAECGEGPGLAPRSLTKQDRGFETLVVAADGQECERFSSSFPAVDFTCW